MAVDTLAQGPSDLVEFVDAGPSSHLSQPLCVHQGPRPPALPLGTSWVGFPRQCVVRVKESVNVLIDPSR